VREPKQVVMLPTSEASNLILFGGKTKQLIWGNLESGEWVQHQHLYVLSNENINTGDWYYDKVYDRIAQNQGGPIKYSADLNWRKVIATTNPTLHNFHMDCPSGKYWEDEPHWMYDDSSKSMIPTLSSDFIQAYIKAHNTHTPIKEILVEYEEFINQYNTKGITNDTSVRLKLRPDGTIIIHPIKEEMYTATQVQLLMAEMLSDYKQGKTGMRGLSTSYSQARHWWEEKGQHVDLK
jgi:hypothetical protein